MPYHDPKLYQYNHEVWKLHKCFHLKKLKTVLVVYKNKQQILDLILIYMKLSLIDMNLIQ